MEISQKIGSFRSCNGFVNFILRSTWFVRNDCIEFVSLHISILRLTYVDGIPHQPKKGSYMSGISSEDACMPGARVRPAFSKHLVLFSRYSGNEQSRAKHKCPLPGAVVIRVSI